MQDNEWLRQRLADQAAEISTLQDEAMRMGIAYNIMSTIAGIGWAVVIIGSALGVLG